VNRALKQLGWFVGDLVTSLLTAAAWLLSPIRLGRLLRTVSIPRMREHRARTSLTVLGVSLGVAVLVAVRIVAESVLAGVSVTVDNIAGKADLQLSTASSGFDEALLDRIHSVPGVYKATPVVQQTATILHPEARGDRVLILGVDLLGTEDSYFRDYNSEELEQIRKDQLQFLNSTSNLLISRQVADRYHLKLHDKISIATHRGAQDFEIWGFVNSEGIGHAFGGSLAVMYYPAMQEAFGRGQHIDRVDVAVTPGEDPKVVGDRLQIALGGGFNVDRPATRGERVTNMLAAIESSMSLACMIAILAGGMLVFNTMSISVVQRRRELGTLQALGTTRVQLVTLLMLEGALIGIVASVVGIALGIGLSRVLLELSSQAISKVYVAQTITDVHIRWQTLVIGVCIGLVSTVVSTAVPALEASKNKVSQTLRPGSGVSAAQNHRLGKGDLTAVVALIAAYFAMQIPPHGHHPVGAFIACFFVLVAGRALLPRVIQAVHFLISLLLGRVLGLHGRLANDNLPRDLSRTAATTTALMAGAGLTIGFATFNVGFVQSLQTWSAQSVPGDLYVTSGASMGGLSSRNVPMVPELGQELAKIDGIAAVQYLRLADYDYQTYPVKLISLDSKLYEKYGARQFLEGSKEDEEALRSGEKVSVSENFSHRFNVHRGDTLHLSGKEGGVALEVAAVVVDYSSDIGTVRMDRSTYLRYWGDDRVDTFEVHIKPGVDVEEVRRAINEQYGEQYNLFVLTNSEFRGEMLDAADGIFSMMRVLELVLLVVAALGIINSLLANVIDRIREIGVLRALGMLRRHVAKMVVIEATLIGLVGIVGGAVTGIALGYVIVTHVTSVQTGWYFAYQVPWGRIGQVIAITLPIAGTAGFYPAKQAASLVVRDALDYE